MSHTTFPKDLPVPIDDGACSHLVGQRLPRVGLLSTSGEMVECSSLLARSVIFCYPRTGAPDEMITEEWNSIPGARGCTPQACSFRDESQQLHALGVAQLYGLSTQNTPYQKEVRARVHLPYHILSDNDLAFADSLKLPTFDWQGQRLIKRLTLLVEDGVIVKVWYPVFPPDKNASDVVQWLQARK
uniref:Redoxin family protein n=1 Tax=Alternaria alternata TaxID=5599 RepID=C9K7D1_ALTAL|nr:redoxin family protein [Alternaria alternata]